ncbi:unnamed protein product [Bemisia tabaci]|uniref:Uncharacterized protein n=1 Tax=Bemisia tabaci TaxID=7038 RepID=A0A9P0C4N3_BEMTA|nr:unnamed protein product [Bemisia tabaci]
MSAAEEKTLRIGEQTQLPSCLRQMLEQECCTDVTLCCQGKRFSAHRVLLSACSTYLREILLIHRKKKQATVILQDVQAEDMESLLCFLYSGEVTLPEKRLESFMSLAHQLKISVFIDQHLYERSITLGRHSGASDSKSSEPRNDRTQPGVEQDKKENLLVGSKSEIGPEISGSCWVGGSPTGSKRAWQSPERECPQWKRNFDCDTKPPPLPQTQDQGQTDVLKESYLIAQKLGTLEGGGQFERYDQFLSRIEASAKPPHFEVKPEAENQTAFHCNVNYQHILNSLSGGPDEKILVTPSCHTRLSPPEHLIHYFHSQLNYNFGNFPYNLSKAPEWPWMPPHGPWARPEALPEPVISPPGKERFVARGLKTPGGILTPSPWAQNKIPCVGGIRRPTPKRPVIVPPCPLPPPGPTVSEELSVPVPSLVKTHAFTEPLAGSRPLTEDREDMIAMRSDKRSPPGMESARSDGHINIPKMTTHAQHGKVETPAPQSTNSGSQDPTSKPLSDTNNNRCPADACPVPATMPGQTLETKRLVCTVCKKTFDDQAKFLSHQTQHARATSTTTDGKKVQAHECSCCQKEFLSAAALRVHMRTHTGEKPFQCVECGKQFSQLRNYKYHRSVHEGTKEFAATCPECGKYFNDRGYLSSHMKIHRNRKEYGCEFCGKSFNQRVAYNMHVRIHTGEKPHVCPHCSKCFSRKMLLKQHLRIHTGEKPFQCVICQKAFADRSNMTLHMRLHSGVKPYTCTVCSKSFTKKHHLKTHMNYHTGVKPYSCQKCGLKFSQSSNMRTHFKKCVATAPKQPSLPVNLAAS